MKFYRVGILSTTGYRLWLQYPKKSYTNPRMDRRIYRFLRNGTLDDQKPLDDLEFLNRYRNSAVLILVIPYNLYRK